MKDRARFHRLQIYPMMPFVVNAVTTSRLPRYLLCKSVHTDFKVPFKTVSQTHIKPQSSGIIFVQVLIPHNCYSSAKKKARSMQTHSLYKLSPSLSANNIPQQDGLCARKAFLHPQNRASHLFTAC